MIVLNIYIISMVASNYFR